MPVADINHTSIHYRTDGERHLPCLVFSNSLGTDLGMWDAQAAALVSRFHVLRYDTRGHGRSASPPGPYTLEQLGGDVLALLDHLDIERAHFCGLSMGGVTGQWLGVHAPRRLIKLVLANTAARVGTAEGWQSRAAAVRAHGLGGIADGAASRWFGAGFAEREAPTVARMTDALRAQDPAGYAACCEALAAADMRGALHAVPAPTLIIAGSLDPVTTVADAEAMRAEIGDSRVATLPASHISNVESPARFTRALLDFLA
ncbi:3-oxoadipate enol-lactonase [Pseudoduganella namucuonensis]|uniref:3-oxoadipate enol-lactonase n=1 Tax=Pseudoduganella namucuonensis TaxID=1035707 RepID=A0A1I7J824_9BURK|nr:3-oxoadipate enol-lactonase [Pseudoduganella namucuonensis]SFU81317.1 3-oxoadipate enol-lactonase [Pseudoduganella namucuonensis]